MKKSPDIDLTNMTKEQVLTGMGDLLLGMLGTHRVAVSVMSEEGAVTFLNPLLVKLLPAEDLARELLSSWSEDEVEKFLEHVYE